MFPRVILILIYVTIWGSGAFRQQHSAEAKSWNSNKDFIPVKSLFYYFSNIITWETTYIIDHRLHWASSHKSEKEEKVLRHCTVDKGHHYSLIRAAANTARWMYGKSHAFCLNRQWLCHEGREAGDPQITSVSISPLNPIWCPAAPRELSHCLFTWI